ncbi:MAG: PAS domain S-box protein [Deltaproteobacteria bacterium]|nr:PAS domain S-box protein [Deltaproteobacteria bacterium]
MSLKEIRPFEDEHVGWTAATLESVSDMVFIADLKDRLIYANPAALKKFGYTKEELLGKTGEVMMSPNNPKELRAAILRATQESPYCWEGEVLNITKDGQEYTVHLNTALVRNKRGEPIGLTGISRDITERKKAQEQLEEYARKLEQANQELREMQGQLVKSEKLAAIGVLAAGLAHEIGNPLASISSLVQLLQRKILDVKAQESFHSMGTHIQRISHIIQHVSDFTKHEQMKRMAVDLEPLVRNTLQRICLQNNDWRIEIHTKIESGLPRVSAEASQLSQAFFHIFVNAFEAMDKVGRLDVEATKLVKEMISF